VPAPGDVVQQILTAWETSRAELARLREQVEHASRLATAKVQSDDHQRERDRAYRALGEAIRVEVRKGLVLPATLAPLCEALEAATARIQAQNASIDDLLSEGEDLARTIQEKGPHTSKTVAYAAKKR
jgi:hypothetical protein